MQPYVYDFRPETQQRSGADNPVPQADVQHPMPGYEMIGRAKGKYYPPSGVPGGPQQRYNPFTDGPPPVDSSSAGEALFMSGAFIFGVGVGLVFMAWVL